MQARRWSLRLQSRQSSGAGPYPLRMQQHTDLARFCRGMSLPLALCAQWTRTASANAGRIHQAQTAIGFLTPLLEARRLPRRTAEGPIGPERKVGSGEASRFPGGGGGGWTHTQRWGERRADRWQLTRSTAGWREQIRSCAEASGRADVPIPGADSTPID